MSKDQSKPDRDRDRLKLDNELRKIKLSLEKGAVFSDFADSKDLSPEIEAEFLKNIEAFEEQYQNTEQISVFDFIGRPEFPPEDSISDDEIGKALENIMKVLNTNGIVLETLCDVGDRDLYAFIMWEFLFHEIDNIRIEGMTLHFIYEDFHPNHEYNILCHSADFMQSFLDKDAYYYPMFFSERAKEENALEHFRESFNSFGLNQFSICSVSHNDQKAEVVFQIDFSATIENSSEIVQFKGEGHIELVYQNDFWYINKVKFPVPNGVEC